MPRPDFLLTPLTADERANLNSIIAKLKPGIYMKCAKCERFGQEQTITFDGSDIICTECAP